MDNYVGKRLDGRYEIHEIIGVGGMAVVYKAYDNIDQKIVAVKILKDEYLANDEFRRRFKNESKAIAVLSHPNIVKVLDVSFGDRLQYIVMEYVEGITLKEYIQQQGCIRIREALYFVMQILRALQHAHDKGIVHRDIKPQNIMLISNGTIKVTDFGIAMFSRDETKTMTEDAIGSVHYISPEQAKGSLTDAKSDIYSVGVVLYEMLTGCLPFQSENAVSVALMQLQQQPKSPREINPDIPIGLEQIVMRAMQKNTADRYQSAAEMLVDLGEFGRNPNIKFDYNFFVDDQPTKFIPAEEIKKKLDQNNQNEEEGDSTPSVADAEEAKRKKTIGILAGVLGGLVVFVIIMIAVFASGSSKNLTVPDFLDKNYTEEIATNKEYADFLDYIETEFVTDSDADDGMVIGQKPDAGTKVEKGEKIVLQIASGGVKIKIPDVYGYDLATAQNTLRSNGFLTAIEYDTESDAEIGSVVKTSPKKGDSAPSGSTVTIYVAAEANANKQTVVVPVLRGETLDSAKKILSQAGLVLDTANSTYRDSDRPKGQIIGNDLAGQEAPKGTKIYVIMSSGYHGHVDVDLKLPDADGKKGTVVIKVDGEEQEKVKLKLNGENETFSIGCPDKQCKITIYIDDQKVYSAKVDLTNDVLSGNSVLSSEKTYKYKVETTSEKETTTKKDDTTTTTKPKPTNPTTTTTTTTTKPTTTTTTKKPETTTTTKPEPTGTTVTIVTDPVSVADPEITDPDEPTDDENEPAGDNDTP